MKKVLMTGTFVVLGAVALSSCKKDYVCNYTLGGVIVSSEECNGCSKTQRDAFETICNLGGGKVATK